MTAKECIMGRRSIRQFTDQMISEEILAEILESTDDKDAKEEIMFLQDLYASKYPLTQDPKTNEITPEDRERFDGMTTYAQVLSAYIVSGLSKCGLLTFTAELQK